MSIAVFSDYIATVKLQSSLVDLTRTFVPVHGCSARYFARRFARQRGSECDAEDLLAHNADFGSDAHDRRCCPIRIAKEGRGHLGCLRADPRVAREAQASRILKHCCVSGLKKQGLNAVPLNELPIEKFVYKVLDEMMSGQMYGRPCGAGRELRGDRQGAGGGGV